MPYLLPLLGTFAMLLGGSLMAGLEASLLVLPEARLRALRDELGPRGAVLERYLTDPNRTLSRLLVGRVLFPIAATAVATTSFVRANAPWWELPGVVLVTAFVYGILAEIAVTLGRRRARSIAPVALAWLRPVEWLFTPLALPFVAAGRWAASRLSERSPSEPPPVTEKEVEYVVEEAQSSGAVDPISSKMLQNVFGLKELTTRDIMVPRTQMVALDISTPLPEALRRLTEEGHSRIPVYRQQIDNVVGVLFAKDLYRIATERVSLDPGASASDPPRDAPAQPGTLDAIVRKPVFFVSHNQSVLSVLRDMQAKRMHIAVVVDEFGAVAGIVTLEDILEELVGEIQDEHDIDEASFVELGAGRYLVSASMGVQELGTRLTVDFPQDEDYASLGGFLAARSGKVPEVGTVVVWQGMRFIVREGDKRRATKVEIVRDARRSAPAVVAAAD